MPFPVARSTSISIFAPSSPGGSVPDSTSPRTIVTARSTSAGSPWNVARRAYISAPLVVCGCSALQESSQTTASDEKGHGMATKADFTEDEWKALQRGVTGAGMLVSVSDTDFT